MLFKGGYMSLIRWFYGIEIFGIFILEFMIFVWIIDIECY